MKNNDGENRETMRSKYIEGGVSKLADGPDVECEGEIRHSCGVGSEQPCHSDAFGEMGKTGDGLVWEGKPRILCVGHIQLQALLDIQVEMSSKR